MAAAKAVPPKIKMLEMIKADIKKSFLRYTIMHKKITHFFYVNKAKSAAYTQK